MKKWGKALLALTAVAATTGAVAAYLKKHNDDDLFEDEFEDEFEDQFEEEDFDLDSDLEPITDRQYASLNNATDSEE